MRLFPFPSVDREPAAAGPSAADSATAEQPQPPAPRRGVTSMEYLVMISFILLALILAAQGVGVVTSGLFRNSADATAKTNSE